MIFKYRPFFSSLLIHAFAFGFFLFWLFSHQAKKVEEPLTIRIASLIVPPHQNIQPIIPPKQPTPSPVIAKNIPTSPVIRSAVKSLPIVASPTPSMPVAQIKPQPIPVPAPLEVLKPVVTAPPPPVVNIEKEFLNAHLGEIRALLLQNLKYPKMAQKLKMQGDVRIAFSLNSDGSVEDIKIIESSSFEILDDDARGLIEKMAGHFPKPTKSVRISVPLSYVLH